MHVFGLTGGLASGKSTVGALYRSMGVPVVDADLVAREVVKKGLPALAELAAAFGADVLRSDGDLDRVVLARRVFGDAEAKAKLDAIMHPKIRARSAELLKAHADSGEPLACYEAALLVETGMADAFRPLVVVAARPELQLARAMARDGEDTEAVKRRLASQMPLEAKVAVADFVVENNADEAALKAAAEGALLAVCARVGVDGARYGLATAR
ncbi:MAG: dephospho-CoA kinase [Myxococcales bacterium]|nr:dephospho-CoA kinase [Myxococcales bacterium]